MAVKKGTKRRKGESTQMVEPKLEVDMKPYILFDPISAATLDVTHPNILNAIIFYASRDTLCTLLRCSKRLFKVAAPQLYRHLRLTQCQFADMVEAGRSPSPAGSPPVPGFGENPFSSYRSRTLAMVRSLHFTEFTSRWIMPDLLRGRERSKYITSIFLRRQTHPDDHHPLYIPAGLVSRLPSTLRHITLLLRSPHELEDTTFECCRQLERYVQGGRMVTIVLLPYRPTKQTPGWSSASQFWAGFSERLHCSSELSYIRVVGTEYAGYTHEPGNAWDCQSEDSDSETEDEIGPVYYGPEYSTFAEWLDEQEEGAVFGLEEEAALRRIDQELLIKRSKSVEVVLPARRRR